MEIYKELYEAAERNQKETDPIIDFKTIHVSKIEVFTYIYSKKIMRKLKKLWRYIKK